MKDTTAIDSVLPQEVSELDTCEPSKNIHSIIVRTSSEMVIGETEQQEGNNVVAAIANEDTQDVAQHPDDKIVVSCSDDTDDIDDQSPPQTVLVLEDLRTMNKRLENEKEKMKLEWETMKTNLSQGTSCIIPVMDETHHHQESRSQEESISDDHREEDQSERVSIDGGRQERVDSLVEESDEPNITISTRDAAPIVESKEENMDDTDNNKTMTNDEKKDITTTISSLESKKPQTFQNSWLQNSLAEWRLTAESATTELESMKKSSAEREETLTSKHKMDLSETIGKLRILEVENEDLRTLHDEMRSAMKGWSEKQRKKVDGLMTQLHESSLRETTLLQELSESREQLEMVNFTLNETKKKCKAMDGVLVSHQRDIVSARRKVAVVDDENNELREVNRVQSEMMSLLCQVRDAMENQVQEQQKTERDLRSQLDIADSRETQLHQDLQDSKLEIEAVNAKCVALERERLELQTSITSLEGNLEEAMTRITEIEQENEELRGINTQVADAMQEQAEEEQTLVSKLKSQLQDTAGRESLLRKTLLKSKDASEVMRRSIEALEKRIRQLEDAYNESRLNVAKAMDRSDMLNDELEKVRNRNRILESEKVHLSVALERMKIDLKKCEQSLENVVEESNKTKLADETSRSQLEEELHLAKEAAQSSQHELAAATMSIAKLQGEVGGLQHSLRRMEQKSKRDATSSSFGCGIPFVG